MCDGSRAQFRKLWRHHQAIVCVAGTERSGKYKLVDHTADPLTGNQNLSDREVLCGFRKARLLCPRLVSVDHWNGLQAINADAFIYVFSASSPEQLGWFQSIYYKVLSRSSLIIYVLHEMDWECSDARITDLVHIHLPKALGTLIFDYCRPPANTDKASLSQLMTHLKLLTSSHSHHYLTCGSIDEAAAFVKKSLLESLTQANLEEP